MKRSIALLLVTVMLCSCSSQVDDTVPAVDTSVVSEVATSDVDAPDSVMPDITPDANGIHIDLTQMSSTMVYSQVFCLVSYPQEYVGMTVRMNGRFGYYHDQAADKDYFSCIITDATACCAQGVEFELQGEHTYPDDYPKDGDMITVTGVFDYYEENGYTYCILRDATMEDANTSLHR